MPFKSLFLSRCVFSEQMKNWKQKLGSQDLFLASAVSRQTWSSFMNTLPILLQEIVRWKIHPLLKRKKYTFRNFSGPKIEEAVLQRSLNAWLTKDSKIVMRNRFHSFLQRFIAKTGIPQEGNLHDCHVKKGKLYFGTPES